MKTSRPWYMRKIVLPVLCILGWRDTYHSAKDIAEIIGIIKTANHGSVGNTVSRCQFVLGKNDAQLVNGLTMRRMPSA